MLKDICLEGNRMNSSLILSILKPGLLFCVVACVFRLFSEGCTDFAGPSEGVYTYLLPRSHLD